jgi:predicted nucleic acid-binding protein
MARGWKQKAFEPGVLVVAEHHGTFYMDASTEDALHVSALKVLRGRMSSDDWYQLEEDEEFRLGAAKVISKKDGANAWRLLQSRNDVPDEKVSFERLLTSYYEEHD